MKLNFYHSQLFDFSHNITHFENTITYVSNWMSSNDLNLISSKLSVFLIALVYHNNSLNSVIRPNNVILPPVDSARNVGVIFDTNLSFAQHISAISKSCFYNIRHLRRNRNSIDQSSNQFPVEDGSNCVQGDVATSSGDFGNIKFAPMGDFDLIATKLIIFSRRNHPPHVHFWWHHSITGWTISKIVT